MPLRHSLTRLLLATALALGALVVAVGGHTPATAGFTDVNSAIRYDNGKVPGQLLAGIWDWDDNSQLVSPAAFPLNFFGRYAPDICVTTNGGVYLGNNSAASFCDDDYDYSLSYLAYYAEAPMIAVLALDLDTGEVLTLPDERDVDDLDVSVSEISVSGTEATVTTSASHLFEVGDHVAFLGTGTVLDVDSPNFEVTSVGTDTLTFATGIVDLDPVTGGDQASVSTGGGQVVYSDGIGALRGVYYDATTINGEDAIIVTWYRIPNNDDGNSTDRSNTLQLVLIKNPAGATQTGDAVNGFDFTVEFNYGSLTDDEDGYSADAEGSSDCSAYSGGVPDEIEDCRWGVGWVNWLAGVEIASVEVVNGVATLTTAGPHGIVGSGNEVRLWLPDDASSAFLDSSTEVVATVVGDSTLSAATSVADHALVTFAAGSGPLLDAADSYELFADTPITELVDGGSKPLTANKLNTSVNGRYVFSMQGGVTQGFEEPQLVTVTAPTTTAPPPAPVVVVPPTTVPPTTVAPLAPQPVPTPDGELPQKEPGASEVLLDGEPVDVEVLVEAETDLVVRHESFELRLAAECTTACPITTNPSGRQVLTLKADGRAAVRGSGFQAGTPVYVWLFSEPRLLGELTVGPDGSFSGMVPLGDVAVGEHTLQVNGLSVDGLPRTANLGVVVNEVAPEPVTLPATGTQTPTTWLLLVMSLGGVLLLLGRRGRTA